MASSSPPILRPIPRRPFDLNVTSPTPPDSTPDQTTPDPARLEAKAAAMSASGSASGTETPSTVSRNRSFLNLTSSTLMGIYMPTSFGYERDELETPWGTGALTPARIGLEGEFEQEMDPLLRRPEGSLHPDIAPLVPAERSATALVLRSLLLFIFGMSYGLLVTHLHNDQRLAPFGVEGIIKPSYELGYLTLWGLAGVGVGSLLPWIDSLWEHHRQSSEFVGNVLDRQNSIVVDGQHAGSAHALAADWNPVVRSVGAFVGISFAIRRLPWTSTLQASSTLALVNPVLWYLVDRSKTGFILAASVSFVGASLLVGLNPEMMPAPARQHGNYTIEDDGPTGLEFLGVVVAQETLASAIWILSVIFCSCVCFGNVGRRLALMKRRDARTPVRTEK